MKKLLVFGALFLAMGAASCAGPRTMGLSGYSNERLRTELQDNLQTGGNYIITSQQVHGGERLGNVLVAKPYYKRADAIM